MEFLSQLLPIIIYFLLIIIIVVGIVLGIKLIITIDKLEKIVNDVNDKIEKITPLFNVLAYISDKANDLFTTVISTIENLFLKLFIKDKKNKKEEMESEDNE